MTHANTVEAYKPITRCRDLPWIVETYTVEGHVKSRSWFETSVAASRLCASYKEKGIHYDCYSTAVINYNGGSSC